MAAGRKQNKRKLRRRWTELKADGDRDPQQRGYDFEQVVFELASFEGIPCEPAYRLRGEQVDGFLEIDGRFLLVETKWTAAEVDAGDVYVFRSKVEGKLTGTIGLFIAYNDFTESVADVPRYGKELNVILMTGDDMDYCLKDRHSLREIPRAKLRRAAAHGEVYYPYRRKLSEDKLSKPSGARKLWT